MADIRNIKILGTVEASNNSSIILTGSNTLIKKVLDDGTVLFEVNDSSVVVSGSLILSGAGSFNSVLTSSDGMYSIDTALHAIDQAVQDKGAEIKAAYEAVRFRHFGTLGPLGLTRLNLTQLATSGSDYFGPTNIKDVTIDLLVDTNNNGVYTNDMASVHLYASGSNLYADIDAPVAAGNPFRFIAVNETLLDVINTSASYNAANNGGGLTAQEVSASFAELTDLSSYLTKNDASASFAELSDLTASNITNFTNDVRGQFSAGSNISITDGTISSTAAGGQVSVYNGASSLGAVETIKFDNASLNISLDGAKTASISLKNASDTVPGIVSNGAQTFAGDKTFSNSTTFNGTSVNVNGALYSNDTTVIGNSSNHSLTFNAATASIPNGFSFGSELLKIIPSNSTVSTTGKFSGDGSSLTKITASYVATGSVIATFTGDVRNQFSAGTGIIIQNGVISTDNANSPAAEVYLTPAQASASFAELTDLTASNITNFTADVRGQFSAGTNITINNGVISASSGGGGVTAAEVSASFAGLTVINNFTKNVNISASLSCSNSASIDGLWITANGKNASAAFPNSNIFIGRSVGPSNSAALRNTIIGGGAAAGSIATQSDNTYVGYTNLAGVGGTGANTVVGSLALNSGSLAAKVVAIGVSSSFKTLNGYNNVTVGVESLYSSDLATGVAAFGNYSLRNYTTTIDAGSAANIVAIGHNAGYNHKTGSANILLGANAGYSMTSGYQNVIIGSNNGTTINNTTGSILICDGGGNIRIRANSAGLVTVPGALTVTGAVDMASTMRLVAQDPLPAGSVGMMAVSGSGLYFHNGSSWVLIS